MELEDTHHQYMSKLHVMIYNHNNHISLAFTGGTGIQRTDSSPGGVGGGWEGTLEWYCLHVLLPGSEILFHRQHTLDFNIQVYDF